MEPKYTEKKGFKAAGMRYEGKMTGTEIPQLWDRFVPRIDEPKNRINSPVSYGICIDGDAEGNIDYVAAVEVSDFDNLPDGFASVEIPDNKYAVFTHKGPISKFHDTVQYVYGKWLRESGVEKAMAPDFEIYDERFKGDAEDSECDLYVSIK